MLFSSVTFLFVFLPLLSLIYFLAPARHRNNILLVASLIFYAWGEPRYLLVMLLTIILNYFGALLINKFRDRAKLLLCLVIISNLAILFYFKYFNFVIENINRIFSSHLDLVRVLLPIGISFYTLQALSYVIDVYRKDINVQTNILTFALYITLFPQLVAGPIVKYHDIAGQLPEREISLDKVTYGLRRFTIGLAKKMIIANTMGAVADKVFNSNLYDIDVLTSWVGLLAYTAQLYYDFSGYSDMAIGLAAIFGFTLQENFNYPYISQSITEVWRRWHISLSTWFKEYVYIPLGGSRVSRPRYFLNIMLVFFLTGLWHGAAWNFIAWGIWNGVLIIFEKLTGLAKQGQSRLTSIIKTFYALGAFMIGLVFFRSPGLHFAKDYFKMLAGLYDGAAPKYELHYYLGQVEIAVFILAVIFATPVAKNICRLEGRNNISRMSLNTAWLVLLMMAISYVAATTYNPFIYFRF